MRTARCQTGDCMSEHIFLRDWSRHQAVVGIPVSQTPVGPPPKRQYGAVLRKHRGKGAACCD